LTLLIFIWFFLAERQNPSKVRYWKKIVREGEKYGKSFKVLFYLETKLFKLLPILKPLCWNVVAVFKK
jgi:hypothetical protein